MTVLQPQTGAIPEPYPSLTSTPFWDGCKQGKLLYLRCSACGGATWSPAPVCSHCYSTDLVWTESSGKGEIYSWTVVWRPQTPAFTVPYAAIVVRMDDGYDFLSNIIGCDVDDVHIGMRVEVTFHRLNDNVTLPYFVPSA